MPKQSAGLMMYRRLSGRLEVFLVHPGGPYWTSKDLGAWTVPKGEYLDDETALLAAQREFTEETGFRANGPFIPLGPVKQGGGKIVTAWAFEGDCDPAMLKSNLCRMEWPPRSGRQIEIPEIDRGEWFSAAEAKERILKSQQPFIDALTSLLEAI